MKWKNLYPSFLTGLLALLSYSVLSGQTNVNIPYNNGPVTYSLAPPTTCSYFFYDNGGLADNYSNNSGAGSVITFAPSVPGNKVNVFFNSFTVESGWDGLFIYDGASTASPQITSGAPVLTGLPNPFSGGAGSWYGNLAPQNIAPATVRATGGNASGSLTFAFDSDGTITQSGWFAEVSEITPLTCVMTAPAPINAPAVAGTCSADVLTATPNFAPGGCTAGLELRYRINGGLPVSVGTSPFPATVILPAMPKGNSVVLWQLVNPCGGAVLSSGSQLVTVADVTPPSISCPASVTLTLGPGDCTEQFDYTITGFDNCAGQQTSQVNHPIDFNNQNDGIMFDVANLTNEPIAITNFTPSMDPGTWNIQVYYTAGATTWVGNENNANAWVLAQTLTVTSTATSPGTLLTGFNIVLGPNQSRGIYITATNGPAIRYTGLPNTPGVQRSVNDGVLRVSSEPGAGKSYPFGATFISRAYNGGVGYATLALPPVQLAGLPSNAEFPIGTTINTFRVTDLSGNTATCSFSVTVLEFPNANTNLVCDDQLTVALGPDCQTTINADQILEGGPYRCYDNYIVQVDKIPPFNNGPWVPAVLGPSDIGKTYGVKVTDPATGNFCISQLIVEDNIGPDLQCTSVELPCNFNTAPGYSKNVPITKKLAPTSGLPVNVLDNQTIEFELPLQGPADGVVNDVDVRTRITGDAFNFNLVIELESPQGTVVTLWNQDGGCAGPLHVRFDDEGSTNLTCVEYTTDIRAISPVSATALAAFDGESPNGTWKLRVRDVNGFLDNSTITAAEVFVNYSATHTAGFPNGLTQPGQVQQTGPTAFVVPAGILDGCSAVTLTYTDQMTNLGCGSGYTMIINRVWTAKDAANNVTTCTQQLRMLRPTLDDVIMPPNYDDITLPSFACGGAYPSPNAIEALGLQGYPHVFGQPFGCSINWTYEDIAITNCIGSYVIARKWALVDFCTSQTLEKNQIINVTDQVGPVFTCPADLTVSTDLYTCCATVNLPDVIVQDNCSKIKKIDAVVVTFDQFTGDTINKIVVGGAVTSFPGNNPNLPDTLAAFGTTSCLPIGEHTVYYHIQDGCGNVTVCSFELTVRDYTPPVASCDETTTVAIGPDDPNDCYEPGGSGCTFGGVTVVDADVFNDGSTDNCNFIRFTVRRATPYSDCIQDLNKINGAQPCNDAFPDLLSEYEIATQEGDSIKFYCCEVGTIVPVILRVYQLDALGQITIGPDGFPVYNECQIMVEVQDKLKPGCTAPPNTTVSCENFDETLWAYGAPTVIDNCCLDTTVSLMGQCGITQSINLSAFDTVCNKGTILRTFQAKDCHGQLSNPCTQRIVVTYNQDYYVKFPDDVLVTFCDSSGVYGAPQFYGEDCELLAVSYTDELFTVVPDACYKIERVWHVINWCTYDPNLPCTVVPNPNPNATVNHPSNLPGVTVSAPGTAGAWAPTVVKVKSTDPVATNYSQYWSSNVNCYEYKQIIKIVDTQDPVFVNCPASPVEFCDFTDNDQTLWNEMYWYDQQLGIHDLCEGPTDLSISANDACSGTNVQISYLLYLDLDNDGVMETVVSSNDLPPANTVRFNNASSLNFAGGQPRAFDERPVSPDQKFRFAIQTVVDNGKRTAYVRWNTNAQPSSYFVPQLPYGTHKIKWFVSDGCGNESVCEYNFVIKDCKNPTVVCINGLSANIMPFGSLTVFASDFLLHGTDNCTPASQLVYSIRLSGTGTGFPLDATGHPVNSLTFDCDDLGTQPVEVWAVDKAGNADFCETYIIVQDNADNCNPQLKVSVAGALLTADDEGVEDASVEISGVNAAGPPVSLFDQTDNDGHYVFSNAVPMFGNYTVTPIKDDNPLNGVSTFDLVLISRHILGLEPFNSPYKMIAADANRSGSVTTFDIVELRKLILGIYTELPASPSWRFVNADYNFPNPLNPFQAQIPETKSVASIQASAMDENFVGIKIGDVNGSAMPNNLVTTDDRSNGTLYFDLEDRDVKAGEEFTATFKASEKVLGYQFTMNNPDLEVLDIASATQGLTADNFAVFNADGAMTTSYDGDGQAVFTVRFQAKKAGKLSELLGVSSRITKAEAYRVPASGGTGGGLGEKLDVAFRFTSPDGALITGVGFELYQNEPNPFVDRTQVRFHLPAATAATLTIFDEAGRAVYSQSGDFAAGYHTLPVQLPAREASGTYYYTLKTLHNSATRSMIKMR